MEGGGTAWALEKTEKRNRVTGGSLHGKYECCEREEVAENAVCS